MSDLRKAAEMALAKLDHLWEIAVDERMNTDVLPEIKALRQALAQPEQEPLVWMNKYGHVSSEQTEEYNAPLYTAPPKREWVGLTDEEGAEIWGDAHDIDWNRTVIPKEIVKRIEAKLKEKNKREWVGLTDEERFKIARDTRPYVADTMRAHEEELKRRNT